jgi:hypothetical protein
MSTNVLQYSQQGNLTYPGPGYNEERSAARKRSAGGFLSKFFMILICAPLVLIFPLARLALTIVKSAAGIICGLDLICKFVLMLYYWHTPGMHAGRTFLFHYIAWMGLWMVLYFCLEFVFSRLAGEAN